MKKADTAKKSKNKKNKDPKSPKKHEVARSGPVTGLRSQAKDFIDKHVQSTKLQRCCRSIASGTMTAKRFASWEEFVSINIVFALTMKPPFCLHSPRSV
ncbi:unnamed protein product [Dovyalis caffra]|uniref:Uncharacterized protein n=1 Tax=Dovyalis caffra TaxID=77055 RepID=A0AAV1SUB7_9ROSI|nr:unnamed protein product [Dovyalis caffra]